ncbi:MAG: cell envelope integrity protein TolA, partial [Pseudomonadota bacterium]
PEPEPEPVPDLDQEEEAEPEPEEEEPEPIRAEPEQDDPLDDILGEASNLFDRARTEQRRSPPPTERKIEPLKNETTERRRGVGDRSGMTARVEAILLSQLKTCWVDVQDLPNPERLIVTVKMQLNVDGTINGDARLVEPSRPPIGDNAMQQAITRALRAARKCSPYRLPEGADAYYEEWKDITLVVGPDGR